jgi:hypothetical protein
MTSVPRGAALALAVASGVTLLMAAPVLRAPSERIFGSGAILGREDPGRDPLVVIGQFRTGEVARPYLQPLTDLPGRALARLIGPVAAYNAVVLATFPLAAAGAYLLSRHLLASHLAAMVAALAYAFLPFHVTQAGGHPHVAQTHWMALYFLALWRCVDRPSLLRAAWLVAAAVAVTASNFYGGLIAATLSPIALVAYGASLPAAPGERRWRRVALTGAVLAAAAAAGLVLVLQYAPDAPALAFDRALLFTWSAKWWSYLVPPAEHPFWGASVRAFWARHGVAANAVEHQQVGLAWSLLALAAVAVWQWWRGDRGSPGARSVPALVMVAAAAVLCSLSPERDIGPFTFVRPSAVLYAIAPMFRAYARFGVVAGLMVSLLAGMGAAWLWRQPGRAGRAAVVFLLALAAVESAPFPPWRWRDVLPTHAHRWLATLPGPPRVLDCGAPGADCGQPSLADALRAQGVRHAVVRLDSASGRWLAARGTPAGLLAGPRFADSAVLEVAPGRSRAHVSGLRGFYPREYEGARTWRWMAQTGALRILAPEAADAVLEIELRSFPGERRVSWLLDGRRLGELEATADWRRYTLPLGRLRAGESTLTFGCVSPATVAGDILGNGDPRLLALAVGDWTIF